MQKAKKAIQFLTVFGMVVTAYLIYQHFKTSGSSFCNISDYLSCDIVNKSRYAEIFGIPVSILGFGAYTLLFVTTFFDFQKWLLPLLFFSGISVIFSLYLTYIEFFVLHAVCIFCLTQQVLILFIFSHSLFLWLKRKKSLSLHSAS